MGMRAMSDSLIAFELVFQLVHERLLLRHHRGVFRAGEFAEKLLLTLGQLLRDLDQYLYDLVAIAISANIRQALAFELEDLAVLRAGGKLEALAAFERGHFDRSAERGLREAYR